MRSTAIAGLLIIIIIATNIPIQSEEKPSILFDHHVPSDYVFSNVANNIFFMTNVNCSAPLQVSRDYTICVMNDDGGAFQFLTIIDAWDENPSWSHDGTQIVFNSDRDGNDEIYVMDSDGTSARRLTYSLLSDRNPCWSSDGKRIIFVSDRDETEGEIYVMDSDGSNVKRLTHNSVYDGQPVWSPDDTRIVFTSSRDVKYMEDIYIMNADGGDQVNLTEGVREEDCDPTWSPDGKYIVFSSFRGGGPDIYRMDRNGGNLKRLTWNGGRYPTFSPDGSVIAFVSDWGGGIYVMNSQGGNIHKLTISGLQMEHYEIVDLAWAPRGGRIAFTLLVLTYPTKEESGEQEHKYIKDIEDPFTEIDGKGSMAWVEYAILGITLLCVGIIYLVVKSKKKSAEKYYCSKCGAEVPINSVFCGECGAKLHKK
jgi:Tol biopolymer transport system component/ribosomal protein L40E